MPKSFVDLWTLDAHCDSIDLRFSRGDPLNLSPLEREYHVTLPRLCEGNVRALCVMAGDARLDSSLQMVDGVHQMCAAQPEELALCLTAADVRAAVGADQVAIVTTIEGQSMFEGQIEQVRNWHRLGVRLYSLTHGEGAEDTPSALQCSRSHFGYLACAERAGLRKKQEGLTDFGRRALAEMGRLGIPCDLAHANDATFWDAIECASGPVCVTHGNCAALCPHTRNLTDDMMKALAEKGGVAGLCFYGRFVDIENPTMGRFVEHVTHALELMGPDGVGIGTDFDGVGEGAVMIVQDPSRMSELWEALDKQGIPRDTLRKIAHENFLRLLGD